jgi:hypothetical protein
VAMICRNRTLLKRTLNDRWGASRVLPHKPSSAKK